MNLRSFVKSCFSNRGGRSRLNPSRWLSRDPIGEAGGLNLYGYVENDPVNGIDPLGLEVDARYSIGEGWLTAVDLVQRLGITGAASSGNNDIRDAAKPNLGPIPPGTDNIYERVPGRFKWRTRIHSRSRRCPSRQ